MANVVPRTIYASGEDGRDLRDQLIARTATADQEIARRVIEANPADQDGRSQFI